MTHLNQTRNPLVTAQQPEALAIPPREGELTLPKNAAGPTSEESSEKGGTAIKGKEPELPETSPYNPSKEENSAFTTLIAPPVPKFWQRKDSIQLTSDFPEVKFMAWDFDQSIANVEPFHHKAFKLAALRLIQTVDHDFSEKHSKFRDFWNLARRGFGLQEKDTIKIFTKAIANEFPHIARGLLERQASMLPYQQSRRILDTLTARDRLEANDNYLPEDDYRVVVNRVRESFKKTKDLVVAELFANNDYKIRVVDGSVELIERGKEAGLLVGLATGSPSTVVKPILEMMRIEALFDATVYNDDPAIQSDMERKPYPFPYLELTSRLSRLSGQPLTPSQGVAFEDSLTGIRSAHRAGMHVIVRPPSLPWLFKKLLSPAGEFDGKPYPSLKSWRESTQAKRNQLISELTTQSESSDAKILLLFQDISQPNVREEQGRANRQKLTWDRVTI